MIKKIAWNTFKNTGNINTFLEFKQIKDYENGQMEINLIDSTNINQNLSKEVLPGLQKVDANGNNKNEWNNNF